MKYHACYLDGCYEKHYNQFDLVDRCRLLAGSEQEITISWIAAVLEGPVSIQGKIAFISVSKRDAVIVAHHKGPFRLVGSNRGVSQLQGAGLRDFSGSRSLLFLIGNLG